jgi:hypothetical protein
VTTRDNDYIGYGHGLAVDQDFYDIGWTAICTCGWEGDLCDTEVAAIKDWDRHINEVLEGHRPRGGQEVRDDK